MMKNKLNFVRTLSLGLALLLLLAIPAGAFAETVSVRIPSKLGNLSLPEMPDPLSCTPGRTAWRPTATSRIPRIPAPSWR